MAVGPQGPNAITVTVTATIETSDPIVLRARNVLAEGDAIGSARAATRRYRLPYLDLEVASTDAAYLEACERTFARHAATDGAANTAARVRIVDAPGSAPSPGRIPMAERGEPDGIEAALTGRGLRMASYNDGFVQVYDVRRRTGVALIRRPRGYPPWELSSPLRPFLHWIYADIGPRMVHAATLGEDGRGVLIVGPGGAGKSSTVLAGMIGGLRSVGDDYVLVELGDPPVAFQVYRLVKQDPSGFGRLGLDGLIARPGAVNWQGKHELAFDALGRGGWTERVSLHAILVPTIRRAGRTIVSRLRPREAMLALAPSAVFQMPGDRKSGAHFLAKLVRRLPSFRLDLGTEGREIARTIRGFINDLPP